MFTKDTNHCYLIFQGKEIIAVSDDSRAFFGCDSVDMIGKSPGDYLMSYDSHHIKDMIGVKNIRFYELIHDKSVCSGIIRYLPDLGKGCRIMDLQKIYPDPQSTQSIEVLKQSEPILNKLEKKLELERHRTQMILGSISDAVLYFDHSDELVFMNLSAISLLQIAREDAKGKSAEQLLKLYALDDDGFEIKKPLDYLQSISHSERVPLHLENSSGLKRVVNAITLSAASNDHSHADNIVLIRDIEEEHRMLEKLEWQASVDHLTGLSNRRAFEMQLNAALNSAKTDARTHSLIFFDIDLFKQINDGFNHLEGDIVLKQVAAIIKETIREPDIAARIGGDEFCIVLLDCDAENGSRVTQKVMDAVSGYPFAFEGEAYRVTLSCGVTEITAENNSVTELWEAADEGCLHSKQNGRNRLTRMPLIQ